MRFLRASLILALALTGACSPDVGFTGVAINDPLDLIDDITGPLRLFVLPADTYSCEDLTGVVSPAVPDVAEGMFADAIADLSLPVAGSGATVMVDVPGGDYVVLVRGKGTDPVSMRTDVFIATACQAATIADGETREVRLSLLPIVGMGLCGDGMLSPDEQCEDGNTTDGDGCTATCRSEPFAVNTTTMGVQNRPRVAGARGQRWHATFDSPDEMAFRIRSFAPDGSVIATPTILRNDLSVKDAGLGITFGTQLLADVALASAGRMALTWIDFLPPREVYVGFFGSDRAPEDVQVSVVEEDSVNNPAIAFAGDGSAMVVYEHTSSATGLMGAVFAPESISPGAPFEIANGVAGGGSPDIAGTGDGFVVAFTAGGDVHYQRFAASGTPRDPGAMPASAGSGTQDQPAVGAQPDGSFLVAWRDELIDGSGSGIGVRTFGADGAPAQDPFTLNTTTDGAQGMPSIAIGGGAYAVAYLSGEGARARFISDDGDPIPNQSLPPTTADFEITDSTAEITASGGGTESTGFFMAVWTQGDNVFGRLFPLR